MNVFQAMNCFPVIQNYSVTILLPQILLQLKIKHQNFSSISLTLLSKLVIHRRLSLLKTEGSAEGQDNQTFGPYRR